MPVGPVRRRLAMVALGIALAVASVARAEEWSVTPYGGVHVVAFDRRETRHTFGVNGTAIIALDGYAAEPEAVFVLTTRRGPCVDSGKLDASGAIPMIRLTGKCHGIDGLILAGSPQPANATRSPAR